MPNLPETIKQRFTFEGLKEAIQSLQTLGEEGRKALGKIQSAAVKADVEKLKKSWDGLETSFQHSLKTAGLLGAAFAGLVTSAGAGLFALAKSGAEVADANVKAAQAAGLQVEAYERLAFAASQAGVEQDGFQTAMVKLSRTVDDAINGSKPAIEAFKDIGVAFKDASGRARPLEDILADIADRYASMPDSILKTANSTLLLGRAGALLIPLLNAGSAEMRKQGDIAERLGVVYSKEQTKIAEAFNDTNAEVKTAVSGITGQLGLLFAPTFTLAAATFRDLLIENKDTILQLGAAVRDVALVYVADLINLFQGNDAAVVNQWLVTWKNNIIGFGRSVSTVVSGVVLPIFKAIGSAADVVAKAINGIFGTNINGQVVLLSAAFLQFLGVFGLLTSAVSTGLATFRLLASVLAAVFSGGLLSGVVAIFTSIGSGIAAIGGFLASGISAVTGFFGAMVAGGEGFLALIGGLIGWPALIVAAVIAAGVAVYAFWDDIVAAAQATWDFIKGIFSPQAFTALWEGLKGAGNATWDGIKSAAQSAWGAVKSGADAAWNGVLSLAGTVRDGLIAIWDKIKATGSDAWQAVKDKASAAWDGVVSTASTLATRVAPYLEEVKIKASGVWQKLKDEAGGIWTSVGDKFTTAKDFIYGKVKDIATAALEAWTGATSDIKAAADAIRDAIQEAKDIAGDIKGAEEIAAALAKPFEDAKPKIQQVFNDIRGIVDRGFFNVAASIRSAAAQVQSEIDRILSSLQAAIDQAARLQAQVAGGGGGGGGGAGYATGGHVTGPGSGTSDSILAWLSNGEFVIKAATVQKFGVDFFRMLNAGRLPDLLKGFKGFSVGGLVSGLSDSFRMPAMRIPAFADGGLATAAASSRTPVNLNIGGEIFALLADEDVAQKIERYAVKKKTASAGSAPRWAR